MQTGPSVQLNIPGSTTFLQALNNNPEDFSVNLGLRDILVLFERLLFHLSVAVARHENGYGVGVHGNLDSSTDRDSNLTYRCPLAGEGKAPTPKYK